MDGLSTAVTIGTVLELSAKLLSASHRYYKEVRGAKKEIESIITEISNLQEVLKRIEQLGHPSSSSQLPTLNHLRKPDGPLHQCDSILRPLVAKLEKPLTSRRVMVWPLKKSDVDNTLKEIERVKATLNLDISTAQVGLQLSSDAQVLNISDDAARQNKEKLRSDVIAWLSTTSPSSNHNINRRKHQPGTGEWFVNGSYFEQWRTEPNSFVWLHGSAGCGKSILSSTIIDHVQANHVVRTKSALVYYYFDFNDSMKQKVANFMSSILADLCAQTNDLPDPVQQLYVKCNNGHREPLLIDLVSMILAVVPLFDAVYIVIDALDECPTKDDERHELLKIIKAIHDQSAANLHLLATSRRHYDIEAVIAPLTGAVAIQIESGMVDEDIKMYIQNEVQAIRKKNTWWHDKLCIAVEESLLKGANGMFRWVYCQLDSLKSCLTGTAVEGKLKKLPRDLRATYAQILADLPEDHLEDAHIALRWLVFSERPLLLKELVEALRVDPSRSPPVDADARLANSDQILEILPNLIIIVNQTYRRYDLPKDLSHLKNNNSPIHVQEVKLAHFSVKEFLLSDMTEKCGAGPLLTTIKLNQCFMTEACLYYILSYAESKHKEHSRKDFWSFPLLSYALKFWVYHRSAFNAHEEKENHTEQWPVMEQILFRLCTFSAGKLDWLQVYKPDADIRDGLGIPSMHAFEYPGHHAPMTSLYFAARYGLQEIIKWLLNSGQDVNEECGGFGTPLKAACSSKQLDAARLLLGHGANIDARIHVYRGDTVLHIASWRGDTKTVEFLLDRGANVNSENNRGATPIIQAIHNGHVNIAKVLLDRGADIDRADESRINALGMAVTVSNRSAVKLLLDRGAHIYRSSENEDPLLILGLCTNRSARAFLNPEGLKEIATLLLDRGANINRTNTEGETALAIAAKNLDPVFLKFFLDRGADVFARDKFGRTALDMAREETKKKRRSTLRIGDYTTAQKSILILEEAEKTWLKEHGRVIDQKLASTSNKGAEDTGNE